MSSIDYEKIALIRERHNRTPTTSETHSAPPETPFELRRLPDSATMLLAGSDSRGRCQTVAASRELATETEERSNRCRIYR